LIHLLLFLSFALLPVHFAVGSIFNISGFLLIVIPASETVFKLDGAQYLTSLSVVALA